MGSKSKMPTREEFVEVSAGKTVKEQAAHYGVSTGTISIWRLRLRVARKNNNRPLSKEDLLSAGAGNAPDYKVAERIGLSNKKTRYWRRAYNIPPIMRARIANQTTTPFSFRLSESERAELRRKSKRAGLSMSDYVRAVLFKDSNGDG